jgi:hypothetical protein
MIVGLRMPNPIGCLPGFNTLSPAVESDWCWFRRSQGGTGCAPFRLDADLANPGVAFTGRGYDEL